MQNKKTKIFLKFILVSILMVTCFLSVQNVLAADKLLQQSDFEYLGAFKVPTGDMGGPQYHGLSYGGSVIAYNSDNDSLFIVGHDWDQLVAEISIPPLVNSSDINNLNRATTLQNLSDITEGNMSNIGVGGAYVNTSGVKIGGLLKYENKLIGTDYGYYDAGLNVVLSHFKSGLTLSTLGDFEGMYEVGNKPDQVPQAGFVDGYISMIPTAWQLLLGGKVLSGQSALSILGRTSSGPAAFAFDPDDLGAIPANASALLYYPIDHQTIGTYYSSQTLYNKGVAIRGVFFAPNTRSIVFTGKTGKGQACYGPGTADMSEEGNRYNYPPPNNTCAGIVMTNTADPCCYDPTNLEKGAHAYPYVDYMWAYDAMDFVRIKNGGRIIDDPSPNLVDGVLATSTEDYKPWDVKPYAYWEINFPTGNTLPSGASTYDEVHRKLYVVQAKAEDQSPIVHVFHLNVDIDSIAPAAPSALSMQ